MERIQQIRGLALSLSILIAPVSFLAQELIAEKRAATDYMLHCQGCHQPDGSGVPGTVPPFRDGVARFLATRAGREYLVRVPGVAQSLLDDEALAALLNWLIPAFDPEHTPPGFQFYTRDEVGRLRAAPFARPSVERSWVIAELGEPSE